MNTPFSVRQSKLWKESSRSIWFKALAQFIVTMLTLLSIVIVIDVTSLPSYVSVILLFISILGALLSFIITCKQTAQIDIWSIMLKGNTKKNFSLFINGLKVSLLSVSPIAAGMFITFMFATELGPFWFDLIMNILKALSYVGLVISVCGMCGLAFSKKDVDKTAVVGMRYLLASTILMIGCLLGVECVMNFDVSVSPKVVFHVMVLVDVLRALMCLLGWRRISKMEMPTC